jgi:flagellar hook assembly protein FlgD
MGRRSGGLLLALAVVIGPVVLSATPAFADGAPVTVPVMTAPTDASSVAGDVSVTATSTAASVQFFVDSVALGAPVTVDAGVATGNWATWGLANAGSHTIDAADCNGSGCNPITSTAVSVTINNAAPSLTAPTAGATTSYTPELDGDAAGGGLEYLVDGTSIGFSATLPGSETEATPLTNGSHTAMVTECDAAGDTCDGPSASASFTVASLDPQITSVSPNPFSPNHDGRDDSTTFHLNLSDTETVSWVIKDHTGTVVKTGPAPASMGAGDHAIAWGGAQDDHTVAPSGVYTLDVSTSATVDAVPLLGNTSASVTLDTDPPVLSAITGDHVTFYPVHDGYLDTFSPRVTTSESGTVTLFIYNSKGTIVREIPHAVASPGVVQITWDGRNTKGQMVAAGGYSYEFTAVDQAFNRRNSARLSVNVSLKHLVAHSVTFTLTGDQRYGAFETENGCGFYTTVSAFSHGLRLRNACFSDPNVQFAFAAYKRTLPAAHAYTFVHLKSYGKTTVAPTDIAGGVLNTVTDDWDPMPHLAALSNTTAQWSDYSQVNATNFVKSRVVNFGIFVPNVNNPNTFYDIGLVRVIVGYTVLQ